MEQERMTHLVRSEEDIVAIRHLVREWALRLGMGLVDQTKLVTAASELTRNILRHAGGDGRVVLEFVQRNLRKGLRLIFEDHGPGIPDIDKAMQDGFSTGNGLGLGLGGARRLVDEFEIQSQVGRGTRVAIVRWAS